MDFRRLSSNSRFLLVRPDKIGDLILTTPSVAALKKKFPGSFIAFLCRSYTAPILEKNPAVSEIVKLDDYSFSGLARKIKELRFDVSVHFYVESITVLAAFKAGVPIRIGPFSKLPSILLSQPVFQHRSKVEKHEAEYNFDLVKVCGAEPNGENPEIFLREEERKRGREVIASCQNGSYVPPVIIHPGSKGSAQSWPIENFIQLAQRLAMDGMKIIFTAGSGEEVLMEKIKASLSGGHDNIGIVPAGQMALREFAGLISQSKLLVSNSTGPLHMAVALGVPTVSFYPKLPVVTSAKRWGPYSSQKIHTVLSPENGSDPMSSISVQTAWQSVKNVDKT